LKSLHNDARYPGSVTIHYPLHPFYGHELPVARRFGTGDALQFELQADDRRVLVPAWMTDVDHCRQLTADGDLRTSVIALLELACFVRTADL
jgi:hypothetical protein